MRLGSRFRASVSSHGPRRGRPHRGTALTAAVIVLAAYAEGCSGGLLTGFDDGLLPDAGLVKAGVVSRAESVRTFSVGLAAGRGYERVDLGPSRAGDHWTLMAEASRSVNRRLVVALFDGEGTLLRRERPLETPVIEHTLRHDTDGLWVGLATNDGSDAEVVLSAALETGWSIPDPQPQVVWLDFAGAADVRVNGQPPASFGPFDAVDLGRRYAGETAPIKREIVNVIRAYYADYNVAIVSSDEQPEPAGPHSTVHFGGHDGDYLGMGEGVDRYNRNPGDNAIVYTRAFAAYATMNLSSEEMARMVGNTAAHELGHLLGLYHTRGGWHLMDDARSAWELSDTSCLERCPLAESVFPTGIEDCPRMLEEAVGLAL